MMKVHHQDQPRQHRRDNHRANPAITPGTCCRGFSLSLPRRILFIQINILPNQCFTKKEKL
jgi:hypothetical protein